ncbi:hypothetical protein [Bartonella queenslandensis]|uniref:hypothetical protein n=1 Tax=Bartonella queenslandensis TaxID=481138 RepID=UPI001BA6B8FF|nr:hypothetical protein [Bartonella queenslandensis]
MDDQKHVSICKVISEDWQEKSKRFYFVVPFPVAGTFALVFRESKSTELNQLFAFSARKHLDIAKSPGIPGYPQSGINLCTERSGLLSLFDRCVDDQKHVSICKGISEDWQEK